MAQKSDSINLRKLQVPDTNVFINDPLCCSGFIGDGKNKVVVPITVIKELDKKKNDFKIGYDAREAIRNIDDYVTGQNPNFALEAKMNFTGLPLDKKTPDHTILAVFNYILSAPEYAGFDQYVLISNDSAVRLLASVLFSKNKKVCIEVYKRERVELKNSRQQIPSVVLPKDEEIVLSTPFNEDLHGPINFNGGVLLNEGDDAKKRLFIRKGDKLELIKSDITLNGLKPMKLSIYDEAGNVADDPNPNFGQMLFIRQLMDPSIEVVFAEGVAGSGKTMLALAGGLFQQNHYTNIIIVPQLGKVSDEDNMGFLPGDIKEKTMPWLIPVEQNLEELERSIPDQMKRISLVQPTYKPSGKKEEAPFEGLLRDKYGISVQPIDYIRGQSICNSYVIIEEAQNYTAHQIKTIISRAGRGTKLIIIGDLSQIDKFRYIDIHSSGFTYAIERMVGSREPSKSITATVMLDGSVRSRVAKLAGEVL